MSSELAFESIFSGIVLGGFTLLFTNIPWFNTLPKKLLRFAMGIVMFLYGYQSVNHEGPVFSNDAIVLGILMGVLALVFYSSQLQTSFWKKFYGIVPTVLLCYFIPALLHWPSNLISGEESQLYFVSSRYLLPACLVLLCISIDFKGIINLGPKALIMFFTATLGIIIGGPVALLIALNFFPDLFTATPLDIANGLSTIAGSWIGGGANQTAMKEIFEVQDNLFASMIVVDVLVANIWMGFLLYGANISTKVDKWFQSDTSAIEDLKKRVEDYRASVEKIPTSVDTIMVLGVAFVATGIAHLGADTILPFMENFREGLENAGLNSLLSGFFWLIVIATTIGVGLSFSPARKLEGVGASRFGTLFIFVLVATIGMKMNILEVFKNPGLFAIGFIWMLIHVGLLLAVGKLIKAPFFFVAVGSQANVGGAASAPVVASAFSPALAPVGVLLAVLGYALGTYGALICAILMQQVAG